MWGFQCFRVSSSLSCLPFSALAYLLSLCLFISSSLKICLPVGVISKKGLGHLLPSPPPQNEKKKRYPKHPPSETPPATRVPLLLKFFALSKWRHLFQSCKSGYSSPCSSSFILQSLVGIHFLQLHSPLGKGEMTSAGPLKL